MELRKDYILDRYVIIATERGKRPMDFIHKIQNPESSQMCYFCPGNEKETPPEIGRIEENGKWNLRWFANKFPAVEPKGNFVIRTDNEYFTFSDSYGIHEVIVETSEHARQLWDLGQKEIKKLIDVYADRIKTLSAIDGIKYVQIFKNHGKEAGTSLTHSHSQVVASNLVPFWVQKEVEAGKHYGFCPYCQIWHIESKSLRRVFENTSCVAFTPYASRFPFEVWIFPKSHITNITGLSDIARADLAAALKFILERLKELDAPYNMLIHYAPDDTDLHFHIEILPRLSIWAGFEFSGTVINTVTPEIAAAYYRGE